jgi:hypothetical protein
MGPFKGKLRVAQHDRIAADPSKVIKIYGLASLANTAYQAPFTANNIRAAIDEPGIWPFSSLAFSDEDFEPSLVAPTDKELPYQISVPSDSTPVAQEISGTSKDSLSPEDVCIFPKPGPRCEKRQRKKVKYCILTDSPIKDRTEQETLARAAAKQKHSKGAKNYRNKKWQKNATKKTIPSSSECD